MFMITIIGCTEVCSLPLRNILECALTSSQRADFFAPKSLTPTSRSFIKMSNFVFIFIIVGEAQYMLQKSHHSIASRVHTTPTFMLLRWKAQMTFCKQVK